MAGFTHLLDETRLHFTQDHEFTTWIELINQILENYFTADEQDEISLNTIRKTLQGLQEQLKDANYSQALSPSVIAHYLIKGINQQRSSQRFMVGSVNFCTLMPMRSIPFRVVCLL
ncbi:exodeoxyribonuclease V, 125 kDa subunit [Oceanospirillum sp. MED92]|nr:exodeoxyribonuclease V, 125 kDa subunit [Oceanospirillum sp. MED92] [Neptuniibacter caesariensis]